MAFKNATIVGTGKDAGSVREERFLRTREEFDIGRELITLSEGEAALLIDPPTEGDRSWQERIRS